MEIYYGIFFQTKKGFSNIFCIRVWILLQYWRLFRYIFNWKRNFSIIAVTKSCATRRIAYIWSQRRTRFSRKRIRSLLLWREKERKRDRERASKVLRGTNKRIHLSLYGGRLVIVYLSFPRIGWCLKYVYTARVWRRRVWSLAQYRGEKLLSIILLMILK